GSPAHRLPRRRIEGQAQAQGQVRKERIRAHHGRSIRQLHRHCGRGQRGSRDAEGDGDNFWTVDAGGVGVWAGRESGLDKGYGHTQHKAANLESSTPGRVEELDAVVDTGAAYSWVARARLEVSLLNKTRIWRI